MGVGIGIGIGAGMGIGFGIGEGIGAGIGLGIGEGSGLSVNLRSGPEVGINFSSAPEGMDRRLSWLGPGLPEFDLGMRWTISGDDGSFASKKLTWPWVRGVNCDPFPLLPVPINSRW